MWSNRAITPRTDLPPRAGGASARARESLEAFGLKRFQPHDLAMTPKLFDWQESQSPVSKLRGGFTDVTIRITTDLEQIERLCGPRIANIFSEAGPQLSIRRLLPSSIEHLMHRAHTLGEHWPVYNCYNFACTWLDATTKPDMWDTNYFKGILEDLPALGRLPRWGDLVVVRQKEGANFCIKHAFIYLDHNLGIHKPTFSSEDPPVFQKIDKIVAPYLSGEGQEKKFCGYLTVHKVPLLPFIAETPR